MNMDIAGLSRNELFTTASFMSCLSRLPVPEGAERGRLSKPPLAETEAVLGSARGVAEASHQTSSSGRQAALQWNLDALATSYHVTCEIIIIKWN